MEVISRYLGGARSKGLATLTNVKKLLPNFLQLLSNVSR